MDKVSIKAEIDLQTLLTQLKTSELELVIREVAALILQRKTKNKKVAESQLLQKLNEECVLSPEHKKQFVTLTQKRNENKISPKEQETLTNLIKEEEQLRLKRIQTLGELSQLKGITLPQLIQELGIKTPENA
jgi:hypothetical protein